MGLRFGKKTKQYFDALFDVFYQYQDQGYYDFALDTLKEIYQTIDVNIYYADDSFGELVISANGSDLIVLPQNEIHQSTTNYFIQASESFKPYFIIASENFDNISVDHVG